MKNLKEQISATIQDVQDGNFNPLEAYANLKSLEKYLKTSYLQIEESAIEEAEKYGEKTFEDFGFSVTVRNGNTTYDYSSNVDIKRLEGELKYIKDLLKNASRMDKVIVDENTGETYSPCPIKSGSKQSLIIK